MFDEEPAREEVEYSDDEEEVLPLSEPQNPKCPREGCLSCASPIPQNETTRGSELGVCV